jgi:hypothetical protein
MSDDDPSCSSVIDTGGLHDIANATGNLKTVALNQLKNGAIAVPSWAWQELKETYPEEADQLLPYVTKRVIMKQAVSVGAARIADKLNSGFSKGPYDSHTGLFTAAVATNNGYRVITAVSEVSTYEDTFTKRWGMRSNSPAPSKGLKIWAAMLSQNVELNWW